MKTVSDNKKKSFDIERAYIENKYIVSWKSVYQPFYSVNAGYYAHEVYHSNENMTLAGRFFHMTGDQVNHLIGFELFNNLDTHYIR